VTAVAASLSQFTTFLIGYGGRTFSEKLSRRFTPETYDHAVAWMKRTGPWAVFLMTFFPNPLHLPMTIAIALLRYPPYLFLLYSFLGIGLRSFIIAFGGYYGIDILTQWIDTIQAEGFTASPEFIVLVVLGALILVIGIWQLIIWMLEIRDKNKKYRAAVNAAEKSGKPLLVVGGPWGVKEFRKMLNKPAHGDGDVCLDIDRRALGNHKCGLIASCTDIPFKDKTFGAVFSSHVLEHMPDTEAAKQALSEMNRVAEAVFIAYPSRQSIPAWIIKDHHIWIWQKGEKTHLKQRKDKVHNKHLIIETSKIDS
jgi:membrane protein DedA with SNARE-associated domain